MSQTANLYAHMADGKTITPLQAFKLYGCLALHSRIRELRERGHKINTLMVTVGRKRVGQYSMPPNARRAWHMEAKRKREIKT